MFVISIIMIIAIFEGHSIRDSDLRYLLSPSCNILHNSILSRETLLNRFSYSSFTFYLCILRNFINCHGGIDGTSMVFFCQINHFDLDHHMHRFFWTEKPFHFIMEYYPNIPQVQYNSKAQSDTNSKSLCLFYRSSIFFQFHRQSDCNWRFVNWIA